MLQEEKQSQYFNNVTFWGGGVTKIKYTTNFLGKMEFFSLIHQSDNRVIIWKNQKDRN